VEGNAGVCLVSNDRFQLDPDDYHGVGDDWEERSAVNRPRSKKRPAHQDAVQALVVGVDRGRYRVVTDGVASPHAVTATRARELHRESIVVGDRVDIVGDTSGGEGALARIVRITPRRNVLRRSADDRDQVERVIVANVDQLVMVVATADPEPRPRLIDRYLVAALDQSITPVLAITKADLADPTPLVDYVQPLGVQTFIVSAQSTEADLAPLKDLLEGKVSVLVGHSGVGKSTLVNRLLPGSERAVGEVNVHTGRGRHTSSSSIALPIDGGWVVDTPGVRSFGLGHVSPESIQAGFVDLEPFLADCPKACSHQDHETECGLVNALETVTDPHTLQRITSLRRLLGSASPSPSD
jgi:ribosome biogenesis GTPase / thiamine phosphate phosphatase